MKRKPASRTNSNATLPVVFFSMPDADDVFPPVDLDPRDISHAARNTVFRSLIRDTHAEIYRLRGVAVRQATPDELIENRGRVAGLEWMLSQLDTYFKPIADNSGETAMTTDIDDEL